MEMTGNNMAQKAYEHLRSLPASEQRVFKLRTVKENRTELWCQLREKWPDVFAINQKRKTPWLTLDVQLRQDARFVNENGAVFLEEWREHLPLDEETTQLHILKWLQNEGYNCNVKAAGLRGHGVDIVAKHKNYGRYFKIEVKGEPKSLRSKSSGREVNFVYSLGQIMTRINTSPGTRYKYGLGLPQETAKKALRRIPWQLSAQLNLHVLSVAKSGKVTCYTPGKIKQLQKK